MSATISDYFNKAADGNGNYPMLGVVSTTRAAGSTTLACEDLTGWTTETPVHFSTYKLNADGAVDTTTQTDWKGIVSGNTITNLTRVAGTADTGNTVGDIVELNPTIGWLDDLITGLLKTHKQDGTLKDGIVKSQNIDFAIYGLANLPVHDVGVDVYDLYRVGNTVFLNASVIWVNSVTANSWLTIGDIPAEISPISGLASAVTAPAVLTDAMTGNVIPGECEVIIDASTNRISAKSSVANSGVTGLRFQMFWRV